MNPPVSEIEYFTELLFGPFGRGIGDRFVRALLSREIKALNPKTHVKRINTNRIIEKREIPSIPTVSFI